MHVSWMCVWHALSQSIIPAYPINLITKSNVHVYIVFTQTHGIPTAIYQAQFRYSTIDGADASFICHFYKQLSHYSIRKSFILSPVGISILVFLHSTNKFKADRHIAKCPLSSPPAGNDYTNIMLEIVLYSISSITRAMIFIDRSIRDGRTSDDLAGRFKRTIPGTNLIFFGPYLRKEKVELVTWFDKQLNRYFPFWRMRIDHAEYGVSIIINSGRVYIVTYVFRTFKRILSKEHLIRPRVEFQSKSTSHESL